MAQKELGCGLQATGVGEKPPAEARFHIWAKEGATVQVQQGWPVCCCAGKPNRKAGVNVQAARTNAQSCGLIAWLAAGPSIRTPGRGLVSILHSDGVVVCRTMS
ncbi:hypothetical protein ACFX13_028376 [Malus domestica]